MSEEKDIRVKSTPMFKLKDGRGRSWQGIHLIRQFGFIPEVIIIEKMPGQNNRLVVRAVLTKEEMAKEDKQLAKNQKEVDKVKKMIESTKK
jgi:hypothetical protein